MIIASLNGIEKKSRSVFFDVPIEFGNSLVSFSALVADGLFMDILLGANWLKAVSACLDVSCLELVVDLEKLKLIKLPDPSKDFVGYVFLCKPVKWFRLRLAPLSRWRCSHTSPQE